MNDVKKLYNIWLENAVDDSDLINELKEIDGKEDEIFERFYRELEFGTAGLRGIIGAGTNRMNVYTVRKATQGLADYVNSIKKGGSAAIAFDSRIKSELFSKEAACVLAANGIKVYIYKELMPTPMLSFAVRQLKCDTGIVITASHNPSKYNGYKAYGDDGCQLSVENSEKVLDFVNRVEIFGGAKKSDFDGAVKSGMIEYISEELIERYLTAVKNCSVDNISSDLKVIYTPLNGTGNKPVREILKRIGIKDVTVVPEQEKPDGTFPTAPYPNPEIRQAFDCALKLAKEIKPDLLIATDPDCDRVGIAVRDGEDFTLMSGNDVGCLLLDYILSRKTANKTLPKNPVSVKSIVTTPLADKIAAKYGCESIAVLTGFKYIGGQITVLEKKGEEDRFVFGFEESYGYMAGGYVRDKDAVVTSMLICEMASYYKKQGKSLLDVMAELYAEHGMFLSIQHSYTFEGAQGMQKMADLMREFRELPPAKIGGLDVLSVTDIEASVKTDFETGETKPIDMPKSDVLCYTLTKGAGVIVRPSGTEPKIKAYITAVGNTKEEAEAVGNALLDDMNVFLS